MSKKFCILVLLAMSGFVADPRPQGDVRPMAVAGQFYPGEAASLRALLEGFFKEYDAASSKEPVRAVIVPHAGYVFSGAVAASAYAKIPSATKYDRIFILGPSHRAYLEGASVDSRYEWGETPLGRFRIDRTLCRELMDRDDLFTYVPAAHLKEHCIEVQVPFLQYRLDEMPPVVPVVIGMQRTTVLRKIAAALKPYWNERNLFVISSDFSHYPAYEQACEADKRTADAILTGDPGKFAAALAENDRAGCPGLETSACGQCAIAVLLMLMEDRRLDIEKTAYRNSGDSPYGDREQVVGYNAFVLKEPPSGFALSDRDKRTLLAIARGSIGSAFDPSEAPDTASVGGTLKVRCGAFVTLHRNGRLRGCIGAFGEDTPLYRLVGRMARAAAFDDPRFPALKAFELPEVRIEISVLTPLKRIRSADEFHYGREGIFMVKGGRSGTFLPQVADEAGWTKEEFLGHCARDKAGIGWDGWKDAELYTYEAIVFGE